MLITLHEILEKSNKKRTKILLGNQSSRLKMKIILRCFKVCIYFAPPSLKSILFLEGKLGCVFMVILPLLSNHEMLCLLWLKLIRGCMAMLYNIYQLFRFISFSLGSMYCLAHFFQLSRNRYDIFLKAPLPHCTFTAKIPEIE